LRLLRLLTYASPVQTTDAELGISPDSDEGSSRLSRRNMILGGATVVVAMSLPKNGSASTPLSMTGQLSKNNDGKDDNMNSTTEIPETADAFGGTKSWTNSKRENRENSI
jgi:hypothetical protein